jgi:hypothetical protein
MLAVKGHTPEMWHETKNLRNNNIQRMVIFDTKIITIIISMHFAGIIFYVLC